MKKTKRIGLIVVFVFAAMCFFTTPASAVWYNASIVVVGVGSGSQNYYIQLSDTAGSPAFTNTWFALTGANMKVMVATALTAVSLGKDVLVNCTGTGQFSDITSLYVSN